MHLNAQMSRDANVGMKWHFKVYMKVQGGWWLQERPGENAASLCSPCHANLHSCHVPLVIISTGSGIEDDVVDSMNQLKLDDRFDE